MGTEEAGIEAKARSRYGAWNQRLLETYFSSASSGEEVFLQVSPEELDSLGPDIGGDEGFLIAVRNARVWVHTGSNVFDAATRLAKLRKARTSLSDAYIDPGERSPAYAGQNAPAYLPHLAALVRSTAVYDEAGFYNDLRRALRLPDEWGSSKMALLTPVWEDLQRWTEETRGAFGKFSFRVLGGYQLIGVPRSQGIMSRRDSEQCARVFAQVSLRPGQSLTDLMLDAVKKHAEDAYFLSAAFRQALKEAIFTEPINVRLRSLFDDWDGTVPPRASQGVGAAHALQEAVVPDELGLVLGLQDGNTPPWQIRWRVPPLREDGRLLLQQLPVADSALWSAQLGNPEGSTSRQEAGNAGAAIEVLSDVSRGNINFSVSIEGDDEVANASIGTLVLAKRQLWVLVWKDNPVESGYELREDSLPLSGAAYFLAPPANADRLKSYLEREKLVHKFVDGEGLPAGWVLACLSDCSMLTSEQRDTIPDGESARPAPRAVRLVGGRSFSRAGVRQFASYDLPTIELDAPSGATVSCPGLTLSEESQASMSGPFTGRPLRRFRIVQTEVGAKSYQIIASSERKLAGSARLRVAADVGERVEQGDLFSLDRFGYAQRSSSGLRGVLPASGGATDPAKSGEALFQVPMAALGTATDSGVRNSAPQFFLDSLARIGSMPYGDARDQLARLLSRDGERSTPVVALLELRARGHVEIQTNHKGHLIRVHAVQPALYELPVSASGRRILGVLGSPRVAQWESLAALGEECAIFESSVRNCVLPSWRIAVDDPAAIKGAAERIGFALHVQPAVAIATWAAPLEQVASRVFEDTGESLGAAAASGGGEKFIPASGCFLQVQGRVAADRFPNSQLFRLEDLEMGRLRIHALSKIDHDSPPRYAFARDSRWGVWIALQSFAHFVQQQYGIHDASPWPVPYASLDGTLWLPARINPPVALERALVLCSGDRPELVMMNAVHTARGISLSRQSDGRPVAVVSLVYEKMATGRWLAYKWVPRAIAQMVAEKIGGTLADA